jgi:hypothetical protein
VIKKKEEDAVRRKVLKEHEAALAKERGNYSLNLLTICYRYNRYYRRK